MSRFNNLISDLEDEYEELEDERDELESDLASANRKIEQLENELEELESPFKISTLYDQMKVDFLKEISNKYSLEELQQIFKNVDETKKR